MEENILLLLMMIFLLIINVIALFIFIKKNNNEKIKELLLGQKALKDQTEKMITSLERGIRNDFAQNRNDAFQMHAQQRQELKNALDEMGERIERLTKNNYELNIKLTETVSGKLSEIQKNNDVKLEQMRATVDEKLSETLNKRLDSSFKAVSEQLENVYKSLGEMKELSTGVTDNVTSLNRILTNVKTRGTWAEVQLEGLLNETIPGMFDRNVMTNSASKNIVEFAVRIPTGEDKKSITYLPIDSKFPVEAYIRLLNAADAGDTASVERERKSLESSVMLQAKEIKKYINEPATTPFAIMYLATEGLYSEIISSRNAVAERCQKEFGVMIAGPSTITALLNSLSVGFRAMAINEKAKEVRVLLGAAKIQYEKFGAVLEKARKKIDEAGKSLDEAQSRNDMIQKKLKNVEEIDSAYAGELLEINE